MVEPGSAFNSAEKSVAPQIDDASRLYLDLMKRCLLNLLYSEHEQKLKPFDERQRLEGREWPAMAQTMIGWKRLENIQTCIEDIIERNVPGDLIETGIWRGGALIFMRAVLKAHGIRDRCVWGADSFRGLPKPDAMFYPADEEHLMHKYQELVVSLDEVRANFEKYGLLDDQVRFLQGWFRETLPSVPIEELSLIRLDGDMYESTYVALESLYPKLSRGGYLIVDDYGADPSCRRAVDDFRQSHDISEEMIPIDWTGIYWRRG
jgi:Macrocin-O-methyltransferase (TylF)